MKPLFHLIAVVLFLFGLCPQVCAAPYKPSDANEVVERLPEGMRGAEGKAFSELRQKVEANPDDRKAASDFVRLSIERGRRENDPRFFGYAEAEVNRMLQKKTDLSEFLTYRGILRQRRHDFSGAKDDLEKASRMNPENPQIWATLASIQVVVADFEGAKKSCARLIPLTSALSATACLGLVGGVNGNAEKSLESLQAALNNAEAQAEANLGEKIWAYSILADIAERLGKNTEAEQWYRRGLELDPDDSFTLASLADLLLSQGKASEIIPLLKGRESVDALLLRLVIAEKKAKSDDFAKDAAVLQERFDRENQRGESIHGREQGMLALEVQEDCKKGLSFSKQNWEFQKEPIDLLLYARSAEACHDQAALVELAQWKKDKGLQDVRFDAVLSKGGK